MLDYTSIPGWFEFAPFYKKAFDSVDPDGTIVEIGAYLGCSTSYMASLMPQKPLARFFAVDTFKGSEEHQSSMATYGNDLYPHFLMNMKKTGVLRYVTPLKMTSVEASTLFDDQSLDFVFIDASHKTEDVIADLKAWAPKLKKGKMLAGHDLPWESVKKAVETVYGSNYTSDGACWIIQI